MHDPSGVSNWIRRWLEGEGLDVDATTDGSVMEVTIPDSGGRSLRVVVQGDSEFILVAMKSNAAIPRSRWTALYPLLSRVNSEIVFGAWVLDPEMEALVFRVALPGRGAIYEPQVLRRVLGHVAMTVGTMEDSFRGLAGDDVLTSWMAEDTEEA